MLLWNAYAGYNYARFGVAVTGDYGVAGNTMTKGITGTNVSNTSFRPLPIFTAPASNSMGTFMWVGTGTSQPQLTDYTIPNKCAYSTTNGISVASVFNGETEYDAETNTYSKTSGTLLRNNSTEDIAITEIYLVSSSTSFPSTAKVFYKELLAEPITIGAGKYLEISYTGKVVDGEMVG